MENLTHSLLGAALAELALPADATTAQRRTFFAVGVVAANLPDADLIYTGITPPPLGYLLHHRGHTHTVAGLLVQALLLGLVLMAPTVRRHATPLRARLAVLVSLALLSHLVLDSWNSYGVHPFWPVDARWFYGDAVYILEPWLWVLLGTTAALNTRNRVGRWLLGALPGVLAIALAWLDLIPVAALAALLVAAIVVVVIGGRWSPRIRSGSALAAVAVFVIAMFAVGQHARNLAERAATPGMSGEVVDLVMNPQPANPLCWNVLAIILDARAGEWTSTRGTVTTGAGGCGGGRPTAVVWSEPIRQPLDRLRGLVRRDCAVRAWMQFGRAPSLEDGVISDLRFGGTSRDNFSEMAVPGGGDRSACPPNLTRWGMPRADLLGS